MSVQTQINRISGNISSALAAIADKGVTVPSGSTSDALAELIAAIEAGGSASGFAKVATGTITPSSDLISLRVDHGFGVTPNFALIYWKGSVTGSYSVILSMNSENRAVSVGYISGYLASTSSPTKDTQSITFNVMVRNGSSKSNCYFRSGDSYRWVVGVLA